MPVVQFILSIYSDKIILTFIIYENIELLWICFHLIKVIYPSLIQFYTACPLALVVQ